MQQSSTDQSRSARTEPQPVSAVAPPSTLRDSWRLDALIVAGLAAVFVVLFVVLRELPWIYDPIEYFHASSRLEDAAPFHRTLRSGLLLSVRAAQEVFGYSQAAYYTVPLLSGLGLLTATYALGRMLFSRGVGAAGAALVAFTPPVFDSVHQIWPDLPAAAVFTGAMAVLVAAGRWLERAGSDRPVLAHAMFVGAGLLVGWSYLIREFTVILFPVAVLPFWLLRIPLRYLVDVALGALAMLGFELAYNQVLHGDPFIRIRDLVTKRGQEPAVHTLDLIEQRVATRGGIAGRLRVLPDQLLAGRVGPLMLAVGAMGLASPLLHPRRRAATMLVLWVAGYWAVVTYMSLSADEFGRALHIEKARYWYPALPALVLAGCAGVAGAISRLTRTSWQRPVSAALGAVLVAGLAVELVPRLAALDGPVEPHEYEQLRRWLADEGAQHDSIATTQRAAWTLRMFTTSPFGRTVWDGEVVPLNVARRFRDPAAIDSDLVLFDDRFFEPRLSNWREVTPVELIDLPSDWAPVAVTDGSSLVVREPGRTTDAARTVSLDADAWQVQARAGAEPTVSATAGGLAVGAAGGSGATVAVVVGEDLAAGDMIVVDVPLAATGGGQVVPFCYFQGEDVPGVRTDASSLWGIGLPTDPPAVSFTCTVPASASSDVTGRLSLRLNGPVAAELGPPDVTVVPDEVGWRTD